MTKPYRTEVLTQLKQSEDLGIDTGNEWKKAVIDLSQVESFFEDEDGEGNPITQLTFKSGNVFSINHEYGDFLKFMRSELNLPV